MASGATNLQAGYLLSRDFGSVAYTPVTTWHFGVSTTTINQDGTNSTEPTDAAYARVAVDNNTSNFTNLITGTGRQNATVIEFPTATASWGTITYLAIYDAQTSGNIRYYAQLINPKTVGIDDVLRIDIANLQIKLLPTT